MIEENVVVGGNTFVTKSISKDTRVSVKEQELQCQQINSMAALMSLEDSVKKAVEQYNPKLAFIYASCASGIIGDDIDAIASDLQQEYPDTIMIPIHCEGFKSKICASGFDARCLQRGC